MFSHSHSERKSAHHKTKAKGMRIRLGSNSQPNAFHLIIKQLSEIKYMRTGIKDNRRVLKKRNKGTN